MSTIIQTKRSAVQGKVPAVGDLALGEFAINTYDGKVFIKKNVGGTESIVDVTAGASAGDLLNLIKTVDGSGSGLDADLLDGLNSDAFAQLNSTSANADDYLQVTRNSTDPTLLVNQLSTGDIARFYKGTAAANTSSATQVTITNTGGVTATGTITAAGFSGPLTGNATTATTLQTARTIGGVSFNGSANINLPGVNTAGNQNTTGSAATLTTTRTLWGQNFNGSANVTGNLTSVGNITGTGAVTLTATSGTLGLAATGANIITATTNGTERMRIDSAGNVGIGTASPSPRRLAVNDDAGNGVAFTRSTTSGLIISFPSNVPTISSSVAGGSLAFVVNSSTEAMRITSAGNVGIGTTAPNATLEVLKGSEGEYLRVGGGNSAARSLIFTSSTGGSSNGALHTINAASGEGVIALATASTERLRITAAGNVGIGTSSPATTLDVNGDVTITDKIIHAGDTNTAIRFPAADTVTIETDGVERLRVDSGGRVGIGTNPILRLHVAAASSSTSTTIAVTETNYTSNFRSSQLTYNPVDTTGTTYGISNSNLGLLSFLNCTNVLIGTNGETPVIFATASLERMRITGAGNVGIGTSSPATALDVTGTITSDGLVVEGASAGTVTAATFTNTTNAGGTRVQAVLQSSGAACNVNLVSERVGANFGADFIVETSDTVDGTDRQRLRVAETGNISFYEDTGTTPKFFWDASAEALGIGTSSPAMALDVVGHIRASSSFRLDNTGSFYEFTATTTSTTQTAIAVWSSSTFGGGKVIIEAKDGVNRHITELLVTHNGTIASATEYGSIYTSGILATYDVDISGGNVRVLTTAASTNSTAYKIIATILFS
jgi:hypothetical protein